MEVEIDHYRVLGLPSGEEGSKLSEKKILRAYKRKALVLHPDKRPLDDPMAANAEFQRLQFSYDVLKDDKQRTKFDHHLAKRGFLMIVLLNVGRRLSQFAKKGSGVLQKHARRGRELLVKKGEGLVGSFKKGPRCSRFGNCMRLISNFGHQRELSKSVDTDVYTI